MEVWIGTSGYSYTDWVGDFYPAGLPSGRMLNFYSRFFPLVELNFTFYRPPTGSMLAHLAGQTPPGFQFLVKLPRTISHEQSPRDVSGFRDAVEELRKRKKLLGLLCQLPQSTHREKRSLAWLETLGREFAGLHLAVEFRHRSWASRGLPEWMVQNNLDLVAVDAPDIAALFPRGWTQSGRRAYVRLHSRNTGNWYQSDKERYDYQYSDAELGEWVRDLAGAESRTDQALLLFNNCHRGQAVANARRMVALVGEQAPGFEVVTPFGSAPPVQRSLFE
jgi:uncharacterized protein YecE (DUF72 family)